MADRCAICGNQKSLSGEWCQKCVASWCHSRGATDELSNMRWAATRARRAERARQKARRNG